MAIEMDCSLSRSYPVHLKSGLLGRDPLTVLPTPLPRRVLIVTTPTVWHLYGPQTVAWLESVVEHVAVEVLRLSEPNKTMPTAMHLCRVAQRAGLGRTDAMIAMGGGVCSDVTAVGANLFRRGIGSINLPTTLIGQVDAAIGLKGAVNFDGRKNLLGIFRPPTAVIADPGWLATLSRRHIRSGMAEIAKMAVVRDEGLFALLEHDGVELVRTAFDGPLSAERVLGLSIRLMLEELGRNPFEEAGFRRLVDFGHTISPLIEELSAYRIAHGEAVAIDMAFSVELARHLGLCPDAEADRILDLLGRLGLPLSCPTLSAEDVQAAVVRTAEHRGGQLNHVVPTGVGQAAFVQLHDLDSPSLVRGVLATLRARTVASGQDRDFKDDQPDRLGPVVDQAVDAARLVDHDVTGNDIERLVVHRHPPMARHDDIGLLVGSVPMQSDAGPRRDLHEIDEGEARSRRAFADAPGEDLTGSVVGNRGGEFDVKEPEPSRSGH